MISDEAIHATHTKNPLAMFAHEPSGVAFESQERGEKIILLLRAHIVTLVPSALIVLLLIFIPFLIPSALTVLRLDLIDVLTANQTFWLIVSYYLFVIGFTFYRFIFWYFNVYILTNERVVDVDFRGILHKETSYAKLNQIQDISPKVIGFFGTFFHFGNVYIQTAAERPEFEFHHVSNPEVVAQEILEQVRHEEAEPAGVIA